MYNHREPYRNIVEIYLNRPLKKWEVVHHINGNHEDNRIENLIVFDSSHSHAAIHKRARGKLYCCSSKISAGRIREKGSSRIKVPDYGGIVLYGPACLAKKKARLRYFAEKTKQDMGLSS